MAVITVRNLGQVRIAGDTPTEQEKERIGALVQRQKEKAERRSLPGIVDDIDIAEGNERTEAIENYLKSKEFARLATEVGFAIGGAMTGGTLTAARLVLRPALQTLYRSLGAGVGQATGAGIASTTFDPKEELAKDVLRAFAQGATFEAVGAAVPALISKIKLRGIKTTKDADEAEKIIQTQKEKFSDALGFIQGDEIVINKNRAKTKVYGNNVGNHELLHGIIKASGAQIEQSTIDNFFEIIGEENTNVIKERIRKNYKQSDVDANRSEYFTIFSDAVANK